LTEHAAASNIRLVTRRGALFLSLAPALFIIFMASVLPGGQRAAVSEQAAEDSIAAQLEAGQVDAALSQSRRAAAQFPDSSAIHQLLGAALFKKGLGNEARAAFQRAIELDAKIPQNYFNLALVELSENNYSAAMKALETFVRLKPGNAQGHLLLGRTYHNLNETAPAVGEFKKAIALDPRLPLAHYHLGYAFQSQGESAQALAEFQKEIELDSSFYDSYWLAGNIELERGNVEHAEILFRKGIAVKPRAYQAHYGLGRALLAEKHFAEAEQELKAALDSNPNHLETHYALARAYQQMGKTDDARREFEICSRLNAERQKSQPGIAGQQH